MIEHDSAAHKELVGEAVLHSNSVVLGVVAGVHELSSQVEVVLMHGSMQIDGFTAVYDWQGRTLRFEDREKGMAYAVDFSPPQTAPR